MADKIDHSIQLVFDNYAEANVLFRVIIEAKAYGLDHHDEEIAASPLVAKISRRLVDLLARHDPYIERSRGNPFRKSWREFIELELGDGRWNEIVLWLQKPSERQQRNIADAIENDRLEEYISDVISPFETSEKNMQILIDVVLKSQSNRD